MRLTNDSSSRYVSDASLHRLLVPMKYVTTMLSTNNTHSPAARGRERERIEIIARA